MGNIVVCVGFEYIIYLTNFFEALLPVQTEKFWLSHGWCIHWSICGVLHLEISTICNQNFTPWLRHKSFSSLGDIIVLLSWLGLCYFFSGGEETRKGLRRWFPLSKNLKLNFTYWNEDWFVNTSWCLLQFSLYGFVIGQFEGNFKV